MDTVSPEVRSRIMSAIRSTGNRTTELRMRAMLASAGIRGWRVQASDLPGTPDFAFDRERVAVFVDGCFWHGCPACGKRAAGEWWREKISGNRRRDRRNARRLRSAGWSVVRVWEHALRSGPAGEIGRLRRKLRG